MDRVYSRPTKCHYCGEEVRLSYPRGVEPLRGAWECPKCHEKYPFSFWKIKADWDYQPNTEREIDKLAEAAEALRKWLEKQVCSDCLSQESCKHCHAGTVMHHANDLARAVLEAAGCDRLRKELSAIAEASTECEEGDEVFDCPVLCRIQRTIKAALQRVGKE